MADLVWVVVFRVELIVVVVILRVLGFGVLGVGVFSGCCNVVFDVFLVGLRFRRHSGVPGVAVGVWVYFGVCWFWVG